MNELPARRAASEAKWRRTGRLLCAAVALLSGIGPAQGQEAANLFTDGRRVLETPCDLYSNLIFVSVRVNDSSPLSFLLDSGAGMTVLNAERVKALKLKTEGKISVSGNSADNMEASFVKDASLSLPGAEPFHVPMISLPLDTVEALMGRTIDGILGYDFFQRFVVEADYAGRTIRLYDPDRYRYDGSGDVIPLQVVGNRPFLQARVTPTGQKPIEGRFLVDTGDNSGVSLSSPFVRDNSLVESAPKTLQSFGAGVGGGSVQIVVRLQDLRIGSLGFPQPVAHLSRAKAGDESKADHAGQIGGDVLRRLRVIFDYPHQRLILEKNALFDKPFENDMGGIWIVTEAKDFHLFRVMNVLRGTPGEEAGVRVGDVITAIDGRPAAELTVDTIRQMFRQEGREYVLSVLRGKDTLTIRMKPRRLI
jgi:hypothetical protein